MVIGVYNYSMVFNYNCLLCLVVVLVGNQEVNVIL